MNQSAPWPVYFQPQSGAALASGARTLIPSHILDMFTLRDPRTGHTVRIAIAGCLGGGLLVVTDDDLGTLETNIRGQIQSAEVGARNQFRTIVASNLTIATLDAIEQQVQTRGLNDAVFLYGSLYAHMTFSGGRLQVVPCDCNGHFTIGRIDVLNGCCLGAKHLFHPPSSEAERFGHIILPAAPLDIIQRGEGVALLYPFLDPIKIQSVDNVFVLSRIIYDLLVHLQEDMRKEGVHHPFAQITISVPSRRLLEQSLEADGYQIDGDSAFRQRPSSANTSTSFLSRMRSIAHDWTAPRIKLPPQTTLEGYGQLISTLLPTITGSADTPMIEAIAACIAPPIAAAHRSSVSSAGRQAVQPPHLGTRTPPPAPPSVTGGDWSADFDTVAAPGVAELNKAWWLESQATDSQTQERDLVSSDDWLRDFLASGHVPSGGVISQHRQPPKGAWEDDFSGPLAKSTPPEQSDWPDDFEQNE